MDWLEYTSAHDPFLDFCLWEYRPAVPCEGKLRSVNLLFHSFRTAGAGDGMYALVHAIRAGIGPFRTVWGVKRLGDELRWEYYFYDYKRRERDLSATRLLDVIRPFAPCSLRVNENYHYFMFSLDIDDVLLDGQRELDEVHLYLGNPGSTVSSGICYSQTRGGMRLENFYFFFDAKTQGEEIMSKAACSAFFDAAVVPIERIIRPELRDCPVIVVANKQENDAVYFSGVTVDQLLVFLAALRYPAYLVAFVRENRARLDHLRYDVGFDYRMEGSEVAILKSGFYGIF